MAAEEAPNAGYLEAIRAQNARTEAELFYFRVVDQAMRQIRVVQRKKFEVEEDDFDGNALRPPPAPTYTNVGNFSLSAGIGGISSSLAQRRIIQRPQIIMARQRERDRREDGDDDGD